MAIESLHSLPLGSPAADFFLPDVVTGNMVSLSSLPPAPALLVMFICRHCPYVVHVREEILRLARQYQPKGVQFVAICSNDSVTYPDDAPDKLREMAVEHGFPFPLLHDETQSVATAYDAQCTPDFFLYDSHRCLFYHGRLDDSHAAQWNSSDRTRNAPGLGRASRRPDISRRSETKHRLFDQVEVRLKNTSFPASDTRSTSRFQLPNISRTFDISSM